MNEFETFELTPEDFREMLAARDDDYMDTVAEFRLYGERTGTLGEY